MCYIIGMEKNNIVVFDFDGTLCAGDLSFGFWIYALRRSIRPWLFLPMTIFGIMISPLNRGGVFWRGVARRWLDKKLLLRLRDPFLAERKLKIFGWAGDRIAEERAFGNMVVLASASPDYLLKKLVGLAGWRLDMFLCSKTDGEKPWKYDFLCYGKNKLKRLKSTLGDFRIIRAYSDNRSDMPIMRLARDRIWINPSSGARVKGPRA
jgi:phosphoserine phosphatase